MRSWLAEISKLTTRAARPDATRKWGFEAVDMGRTVIYNNSHSSLVLVVANIRR